MSRTNESYCRLQSNLARCGWYCYHLYGFSWRDIRRSYKQEINLLRCGLCYVGPKELDTQRQKLTLCRWDSPYIFRGLLCLEPHHNKRQADSLCSIVERVCSVRLQISFRRCARLVCRDAHSDCLGSTVILDGRCHCDIELVATSSSGSRIAGALLWGFALYVDELGGLVCKG